jgi:hypothetical protein
VVNKSIDQSEVEGCVHVSATVKKSANEISGQRGAKQQRTAVAKGSFRQTRR